MNEIGKQPEAARTFQVKPPAPQQTPVVKLIRGDAVNIERIDYIWPGFLARGKMHIVAGPPETGKTTIVLDLATSTTAGADFPAGAPRSKAGNAVIGPGRMTQPTPWPRALRQWAPT